MKNESIIKTSEQLPKLSQEEGNKRWGETFWEQRQYILAEKTSIGHSIKLLKYKHAEFEKIPPEIQQQIAKYWGFILG